MRPRLNQSRGGVEFVTPIEVVKEFIAVMVHAHGAQGQADGLRAALELVDENVRLSVPPPLPQGGEWIGHDGYRAMSRAWRDYWINHGAERREFFEIGDDRVIQIVEPRFESRVSGETITHRMVEIFTVRDGKITELVAYFWDLARLVEAAGGTVRPPVKP